MLAVVNISWWMTTKFFWLVTWIYNLSHEFCACHRCGHLTWEAMPPGVTSPWLSSRTLTPHNSFDKPVLWCCALLKVHSSFIVINLWWYSVLTAKYKLILGLLSELRCAQDVHTSFIWYIIQLFVNIVCDIIRNVVWIVVDVVSSLVWMYGSCLMSSVIFGNCSYMDASIQRKTLWHNLRHSFCTFHPKRQEALYFQLVCYLWIHLLMHMSFSTKHGKLSLF